MNILNYTMEFFIEEKNLLEFTICYCGELIHMTELMESDHECEFSEYDGEYNQLSLAERKQIEKHYGNGESYSGIGRLISRSHTTVSREIKRNGKANQPSLIAKRKGQREYNYNANRAQKLSELRAYRKLTSGRYKYFCEWFKKNVQNDLSLEAHLMNFKKQFRKTYPVPCVKSLYNWYHAGVIEYKGDVKIVKNYRKNVKGEKVDGRKSIHQRVEDFGFEMNDYSHAGHYEIDTIYNGDKKGGVLTFNHRATMKLYAVKIPDRKATTINRELRRLIQKIGKDNIKSITSDNGPEFAYSAVIEACHDLKWYYCDPYKSGQRGQNERLNRDVRKYFRKGCYFQNVTDKKFIEAIDKINNYPRKKFKGLSAIEKCFDIKRTA